MKIKTSGKTNGEKKGEVTVISYNTIGHIVIFSIEIHMCSTTNFKVTNIINMVQLCTKSATSNMERREYLTFLIVVLYFICGMNEEHPFCDAWIACFAIVQKRPYYWTG